MLFGRREQVEQERPEPGLVQDRRDEPIPRAVPAAAAAVREHDDRAGAVGDRQVPTDGRRAHVHLDLFVAVGRIVGARDCGGVDAATGSRGAASSRTTSSSGVCAKSS